MNESLSFTLGDVVYLKSGSPALTVVNLFVQSDNEANDSVITGVLVAWFDGFNFQEHSFRPWSLTKTETSPKLNNKHS